MTHETPHHWLNWWRNVAESPYWILFNSGNEYAKVQPYPCPSLLRWFQILFISHRISKGQSESFIDLETLQTAQFTKTRSQLIMDPLPENHEFKHPELAYDVEPNYQPAIKISVYFRKRDGISSEQFHKHWETVHADLAAATQAFQNHILRYVQVWRKQIGYIHKLIGSIASSNTRNEGTCGEPRRKCPRIRWVCTAMGSIMERLAGFL